MKQSEALRIVLDLIDEEFPYGDDLDDLEVEAVETLRKTEISLYEEGF